MCCIVLYCTVLSCLVLLKRYRWGAGTQVNSYSDCETIQPPPATEMLSWQSLQGIWAGSGPRKPPFSLPDPPSPPTRLLRKVRKVPYQSEAHVFPCLRAVGMFTANSFCRPSPTQPNHRESFFLRRTNPILFCLLHSFLSLL